MEWITRAEVPDLALEIDENHQKHFGRCSCCGGMTSRIWGFAYRARQPLAAYFVEWTQDHKDREATFDLIIGRWGEGTDADGRVALSIGFRQLETGPAFMVQNADLRPVASNILVSKSLNRDELLGTALADEAFEICDLIYLGDPRINELRSR